MTLEQGLQFIYETVVGAFFRLFVKVISVFGQVEPNFLLERQGFSTCQRPDGPLFWFHGASRGEVMALKPIIHFLETQYPEAHILITTSSKTSRSVVSAVSEKAFHQYLPYDHKKYVARFLAYWTPTVIFWTESDFWPNMILEASRRKYPLLLLNGRFSSRSFQRWKGFPPLIKKVIQKFNLVSAQSVGDYARFQTLQLDELNFLCNLKFLVPPLSRKEDLLRSLQEQIQNRPIFMAASTHPGEEEILLEAFLHLKNQFPTLLLILIPRHPVRKPGIISLIKKKNLLYAVRSQKEAISSEISVYLADTFGELGTFYALASFVFLGGSLVPIGGHTPIEPTLLSCAVITGSFTFNNQEIFDDYLSKNALLKIDSPEDLITAVYDFLSLKKDPKDYQKRARDLVNEHQKHQKHLFDLIDQKVKTFLK